MASLVVSVTGCKSCEPARGDQDRAVDEGDDPEEQEDRRDNLWRVRIEITGQGRVTSAVGGFDCAAYGRARIGACGPSLLRFDEREPPLLRATAAPGWRFDHWESELVQPDGSKKPRSGPMPDGILYLNGFGYSDTGELEIVTGVFVRAQPGGDGG